VGEAAAADVIASGKTSVVVKDDKGFARFPEYMDDFNALKANDATGSRMPAAWRASWASITRFFRSKNWYDLPYLDDAVVMLLANVLRCSAVQVATEGSRRLSRRLSISSVPSTSTLGACGGGTRQR
jgi:hypothetical protein